MGFIPTQLGSARDDFRRARGQAALQEIMSRFTGQSTQLLSYEEVAKQLKTTGQAERGLKEIPLDAIVGSVGRYSDFTRTFLPKQDSDEHRWAGVRVAVTDLTQGGLPPISVYQIGGAYFVIDGNHRVSVARRLGATTIEAHITEVKTKVPFSPETSPDDLILKGEYADFLERARLDESRPEADLTLTAPGGYAELEKQIEACRQAEAALPEAAAKWYDEVYWPTVLMIRERGVLRDFPGRTETDFFLWIMRHRAELKQESGWEIRPDAAASDLAARLKPQTAAERVLDAMLPDALTKEATPGEWRKEKLAERYTDRLFAEVLVPVSGEEVGWFALEQALILAKREGARLNGLHILRSAAEAEGEAAQAIQTRFSERCAEAEVSGSLAIEVGEVARKICERAPLTDLVILNMAHPPEAKLLSRLGSGLRTITRQCVRPVLAVPGTTTALERVLLAYDGSRKANEALFVATYLAERWGSQLTVLTVVEPDRTALEENDYVRAYLELHEVQATFLIRPKAEAPVSEIILQTAEEQASDLIVMGGYGAHPMVEAMLGSDVERVLRASNQPMLICQ